MTTAPVVISKRGGHLVAIGPAASIRPHLDSASLLAIDGGKFLGDKVWLCGPLTWQDNRMAPSSSIAETIQHPEHGELIAAYVDLERLADAPALLALIGNRYAGVDAAQARADAMVPACGNCGDCRKCC